MSEFASRNGLNEQDRFIVKTDVNPGLDVSTEEYRVYTFPEGHQIRVDLPSRLWVKVSSTPGVGHSHRIALENGNGVYIPAGWLKIEWKNKPGQPPVAW